MVNKIAMASFLIAGIAAIMYLVLDHENYFVAEPKPISITAGPIFPTCKEIEDQNKTTKKLANHIPWTKDYCLKWDNFEGEVEIDKNFTAYTYTHTNRYVKTQVTNTL